MKTHIPKNECSKKRAVSIAGIIKLGMEFHIPGLIMQRYVKIQHLNNEKQERHTGDLHVNYLRTFKELAICYKIYPSISSLSRESQDLLVIIPYLPLSH